MRHVSSCCVAHLSGTLGGMQATGKPLVSWSVRGSFERHQPPTDKPSSGTKELVTPPSSWTTRTLCARCARTVGNAHNKGPTLPAKLPVGGKAWAANGGLLTLPASRLGVTSVWPASRASCWPGAPPLQRVASRRGSYGAGLDRTRGTAARTEVASRTDALNGKMQAAHVARHAVVRKAH